MTSPAPVVIRRFSAYGVERKINQTSLFLAFPRSFAIDQGRGLWPQKQERTIKLKERDQNVVVFNWLVSFALLACVTALYCLKHPQDGSESLVRMLATIFSGMALITFGYGSIAQNWFGIRRPKTRFITIAKASLQ